MSSKNKHSKGAKLRIIPLGGIGEIGKNLTVYEYQNDIIVVDIGSIFPQEDMPGVDLVIPSTEYLQQNRQKLRGYVITHGHEDHIGAAPYILNDLPAPVYATRLTLALNFARVFIFRIPVFWFLQHYTALGQASVGAVMLISNFSSGVLAAGIAVFVIRHYRAKYLTPDPAA